MIAKKHLVLFPVLMLFSCGRSAEIRAVHPGSDESSALTSSARTFSAADCSTTKVRCVGGSSSEYSSIQAAADVSQAGDTVLVFDGTYVGFEINRSGADGAPITYQAQGTNVVINLPASGVSGDCNGDAGICFRGGKTGELQGVKYVT